MNQKQNKTVEKVRDLIAAETDPRKMTKLEYLEVIETISADLEGAIEATRGELEEEGHEL